MLLESAESHHPTWAYCWYISATKPVFHVEQNSQVHIRLCPLCGGTKSRSAMELLDYHLTSEPFTLVDCASCGFRFTSPRPNPSSIHHYYASETYLSHQSNSRTFISLAYRVLRRIALRIKAAEIFKYAKTGSLLDIGCGTGEFLDYSASRGFLPVGVEPNISARNSAIARRSLTIVGRLEDATSGIPYRVITLWHVLEHLENPHHSIEQIHSMLAERGHLFIAVPNRDSWDASHYGKYWAAWDVPRHCSHFRTQDVVKLLEAHNFEVVSTRRMWFDAYFIALLSERYRGKPSMVSWGLSIVIGSLSNTISLLSGRPTSSSLYVARRK